MIASARTCSAKHPGEVAGTVAQQGHCLAAEACQHQFAHLSVGHGLQGLGVDNLHYVVVLPEVQTVLLLTLETHTRTAHLRHAKGVVGLHAHHLLYASALLLGMRLGTNGQNLQFGIAARVHTHALHHLVQTCDV